MSRDAFVIGAILVMGLVTGLAGGIISHQYYQIEELETELADTELEASELESELESVKSQNEVLKNRSHTMEPDVSVGDCRETGWYNDVYECDISVIYPYYTYSIDGVGHNTTGYTDPDQVTISDSQTAVFSVKTPFQTYYYELEVDDNGKYNISAELTKRPTGDSE